MRRRVGKRPRDARPQPSWHEQPNQAHDTQLGSRARCAKEAQPAARCTEPGDRHLVAVRRASGCSLPRFPRLLFSFWVRSPGFPRRVVASLSLSLRGSAAFEVLGLGFVAPFCSASPCNQPHLALSLEENDFSLGSISSDRLSKGLRPEPRETLFASPCASHFAERESAFNQDYTEASPDWRILYSPIGGTVGREVRGWRGRL